MPSSSKAHPSTVSSPRASSSPDTYPGSWATRPATGVVIAVVAGVVFWLTVDPGSAALRGVQFGAIAASVAIVLLVRRAPWLACGMLAAVTVVGWALGCTTEPFVVVAWGVYRAMFLTRPGRRAEIALGVGALLLLAGGTVVESPAGEGGVLSALVGGFVVIGAGLAGGRNRAERDLHEQAASARRRAAIVAERAGLARELHDILSHSLSRIGLQAGVAAEVDREDAGRLAEALTEISEESRRSLTEVRSVLGSLRTDEGVLPGLRDAPELIERSRGLGVDVSLTLDVPELPVVVDVACYRILRELVTNVVKHAPRSRAVLSVGMDEDGMLRVTSVNACDGQSPGRPGLGLDGVSERARLLGGRLTSGVDGEGMFRVEVAIPIVAEALRG